MIKRAEMKKVSGHKLLCLFSYVEEIHYKINSSSTKICNY